ncbi:ornithine decarboxylase-like [Dioscorea cayenensis subsp. rotundata]|uniref:ornithine decarboxylase n=1 Tax=Dioscorea cayennensis subsp. rotundata TaxID=55577 RepID=A0AB40CIA5_DIOCR|nr:ornithine decarboxylase-like [Dioscorea cayenensis subsp. rotundata]
MVQLPALETSPGLEGKKILSLRNSSKEAIIELIQSIITSNPKVDEPFFVMDLGVIVELFKNWNHSLKNVRPYYAVKCNPDPAFLGTMAALGAGFDCASRGEIEAVLALGVTADSIIYANPCKPESHIKLAAEVGVNLTTFDSIHELPKIKKHHPKCSLLLRLKAPDDSGARRRLGTKYGALPEEVEPLLRAANEAELTVIGVSFHVGSGATNSDTYRTAIASARAVFDVADKVGGARMHMLDIGGGFSAGTQFEETTNVIKIAIETYFSDIPELEVIAEPGRVFAETASTLATNIVGKRVRGKVREYWINDGIHGSFSCIKNDTATVTMMPLACYSSSNNVRCVGKVKYSSTIFGPTCDSMDTIRKEEMLPELEVGDWLVSPNMGAYTKSMGSDFNGFLTSGICVYLGCSGGY